MPCAFMPGNGAVVALFIARMLQESYGKKKQPFYVFCGTAEGFRSSTEEGR